MLLAVVVDRAAGAGLAEGLAVDHPHRHPVDLLDVGDPLLVALRGALGEQVVPLGHVRIGVDHPEVGQQIGHPRLPSPVRSERSLAS